jgi:hypothetical protein
MTSQIQLREFSHIGIVTPSVDDFRQRWSAALEIGQWVQRDVPQPPGRVQLLGDRIDEPTSNRIAFTRVAGLPIELIEPLEGRTSAARWLETHGPSIQHVGFWVDDLAGQLARLGSDVHITYSPASLVPALADRPVSALLAPDSAADVRPPFWSYLQLAPVGREGWELELLDAEFEGAYREYYGDFAYYPGDLPRR